MADGPIGITTLKDMKREGRKIAAVVAYDTIMAKLAERAGYDMVSVGDSVGANLLGHASALEITLDEMLIFLKAVKRGVRRALVSCDLPFGALQESEEGAVKSAIRLVKEGGADMVKPDGAADFPERVRAIVRAGVPVFPQMGLTPQTALKYGVPFNAQGAPGAATRPELVQKLVDEARRLEDAGASMLDFTNSGPVAGEAVVKAVQIPVLGGFAGGPWLDGRIRVAFTATGYGERWLDGKADTYGNTAKMALDALTAMAADMRAGRQIKG